jgi:hypothetical protein
MKLLLHNGQGIILGSSKNKIGSIGSGGTTADDHINVICIASGSCVAGQQLAKAEG